MKKFVLISLLAIVSIVCMQSEAKTVLRYQCLVEDANGAAIKSQPVSLKVSIREGSATGTVVLSETLTATTSPAGIAYFNIGEQSEATTLDDLNWAGETYFMDLSIDRGTGMQSLGCTQILSVPKTIHAETASAVVLTSPSGKRFKVTVNDNGEVSTTAID